MINAKALHHYGNLVMEQQSNFLHMQPRTNNLVAYTVETAQLLFYYNIYLNNS